MGHEHQLKNHRWSKPKCQSQTCQSAQQPTTNQEQPTHCCRRCGFALGHSPFAKLLASYLQSTQTTRVFCQEKHHKFCLHLRVCIYSPLPKTLCCRLYATRETELQLCQYGQVHCSMHMPKPHLFQVALPDVNRLARQCPFDEGQPQQVCPLLFELSPRAATSEFR